MVVTLMLASCAPAVVEDEEKAATPEKKEQVLITPEEEEAIPPKEGMVTEGKVVTEAEEAQEPAATETSAPTITPPEPMLPIKDPEISVDIYQSDMVLAGTTLLADSHNSERPRIIEVNMLGEIVWQYLVPANLRQNTRVTDVELLSNGNILFVLIRKGVFEIDRSGNIIWSYLNSRISHDADRLPDGSTLIAWGWPDEVDDTQVKEVNPEGDIVWAWYAKDHFYESPYKDIYEEGWTHTNAVIRLRNGNTLISPRNFHFMVEVAPDGSVVRTVGEGIVHYQHDPEVLINGNILAVSQWRDRPHKAMEIDPNTGRIIWQFAIPERQNWPVRDANRLSNGNTLITGLTKIIEVTAGGEIVWQLTLKGVTITSENSARLGFYKAERIGLHR